MAVSDVQICNLALAKIGDESRISAIGEDGREGEQCELFYEHTRDFLLQSHPWNFAAGRVALSQDATSPDFEYTNQFVLPADYLRALDLYNEAEPYKIEGKRLLTNASVANLKYTRKIIDTTQFTPLFSETLAVKLGYELSNVIAGTKKITLEDVEKSMREAKRRDGQEGTPDRIISTGPIDFKNGFWNRGR